MMYVIKVLEKGGILCSDKKPQIVRSGLFKGITRLDGKRFQTASIEIEVQQQTGEPELVDYAREYTLSLKPGDAIDWATPGTERVEWYDKEKGEMITLKRTWAVVNLNKMYSAIEAFVSEDVEVEEEVEEEA